MAIGPTEEVAMEGDDSPEQNPPLPEVLDYQGVRREILRFERLVERREKRLVKENSEVEKQLGVVAAAQADLVRVMGWLIKHSRTYRSSKTPWRSSHIGRRHWLRNGSS